MNFPEYTQTNEGKHQGFSKIFKNSREQQSKKVPFLDIYYYFYYYYVYFNNFINIKLKKCLEMKGDNLQEMISTYLCLL